MAVQGAEHRSRVGAAAAQARLDGNALGDADGHASGILAQGLVKHPHGLPGQILRIRGDLRPVALQLPVLAGLQVDLHVVAEGNLLHDGLQLMIAVRALAQDVQGQIQFGVCLLLQCNHLMARPSR